MFAKDVIGYKGTRAGIPLALPLTCTIVDDGDDDSFADGATKIDRRRLAVFVRSSDWPETTPPQIGDSFTDAFGARFTVYKVTRLGFDMMQLSARAAK